MSNKYIYGPVPSRRLGRSLGIDIIPFKVCSYDCIYCQLGHTTDKTIDRKEFYQPSLILKELKEFLNQDIKADYITVSGSGEPTLNSELYEIISQVKLITDIPVVTITNGSLLWDKEVRYALKEADLVIPSMDAVSDEIFKKINRPDRRLEVSRVLEGLMEFSGGFQGKIYLEIMLVKGVNDSDSEIYKMKDIIQKLRIDKVQLNTVIRPPSEKSAVSLNNEEMTNIKEKIGADIPVEVIADFERTSKAFYNIDIENEVINLLKRRPCTLVDIANALGIHNNELIKYITEMKRKNVIKSYSIDNSEKNYYKVY